MSSAPQSIWTKPLCTRAERSPLVGFAVGAFLGPFGVGLFLRSFGDFLLCLGLCAILVGWAGPGIAPVCWIICGTWNVVRIGRKSPDQPQSPVGMMPGEAVSCSAQPRKVDAAL